MKKKFTTTIKKKYWNMKMEDEKRLGYFWEYKQQSEFWMKRISNLAPPCEGVFLVGSELHRVIVTEIREFRTDHIRQDYEGPVKTPVCYGLKCVMKKEKEKYWRFISPIQRDL